MSLMIEEEAGLEQTEKLPPSPEQRLEQRLGRAHAWLVALGLIGGTFLVRMVYVFFFTNYDHYLWADMQNYWTRALQRFNGDGDDYFQWSIWPPLYHQMIATAFSTFEALGIGQERWLMAILTLQILAGSLSTYLIYRIARIVLPVTQVTLPFWASVSGWGRKVLPEASKILWDRSGILSRETVALAAGVLYGIAFPIVYFNAFVLSENGSIPLLIAATYWLVRKPASERAYLRSGALAGVLLGLAISIRPSYLLFGAVFVWYGLVREGCWGPEGTLTRKRLIAWLREQWERKGEWGKSQQAWKPRLVKAARQAHLLPSLAVLFGLTVSIGAVCIENASISNGHLTGLSVGGGVNFYMAQAKVRQVTSQGTFEGEPYNYTIAISEFAQEPWRPALTTSHPYSDQAYFYRLGLRKLMQPRTWVADFCDLRKLYFGWLFPTFGSAAGFSVLDPWCLWGLGSLLLAMTVLPPLIWRVRGGTPEEKLLWSFLALTVVMGFFFPVERRYEYSVLFTGYLLPVSLLRLLVPAAEKQRSSRALHRRWRTVVRSHAPSPQWGARNSSIGILLLAVSLSLLLPIRTQAGGVVTASRHYGHTSGAMIARTLDGKRIDLSMQPGWKVVYFWSSICPFVRTCEALTFQPLSKRYQGRVHFYALVSGSYDLKQSPATLRQAVASHHLSFPVLRDAGGKIAQALGAQVTPETFVIDPQGRVVYAGMPDDSKDYLSQTGKQGSTKTFLAVALSQALSGQMVSPSRTETQGCVIGW